jgi:alanine racemase
VQADDRLGRAGGQYRLLCDQVAPAKVAGVVKADGYGLGADKVAQVLLAQGCEHFFVALLCEAKALIPGLKGARRSMC